MGGVSFSAFARTIKLSHTIFSAPFALAATALAAREHGITVWTVVWILVALTAARSTAMGFNRIVDRDIDAANPRTSAREIPAGELSVRAAWGWTLASAGVFGVASWVLGPLCLMLFPVALAIVWGYSLVKRVSWACHLVLGLALALAPTAAWIAVAGGMSWTAALLSVVVATWVAGFDILYSCQDAGFDRDEGLHSIPARLGVRGALVVSALLHVVTMAGLVALPWVVGLWWPYWVGVALMAVILAYEHAIVTPTDLSRIDKAFFDLNGYVSLAFLGSVLISL